MKIEIDESSDEVMINGVRYLPVMQDVSFYDSMDKRHDFRSIEVSYGDFQVDITMRQTSSTRKSVDVYVRNIALNKHVGIQMKKTVFRVSDVFEVSGRGQFWSMDKPNAPFNFFDEEDRPVHPPLTTRTPDDPTDAHLVNDPKAV